MSHSFDAANNGATPKVEAKKKKFFRRGPWENGSTIIIGLGILMLMQPFAIELYTWSFMVILAGSLGFVITSHFPE